MKGHVQQQAMACLRSAAPLAPGIPVIYALLCGCRPLQAEGYGATSTQSVSQFMESMFGYKESMIWWCILIVFAFCFVFRGEPSGGSWAGRLGGDMLGAGVRRIHHIPLANYPACPQSSPWLC